MSRRKLLTLMDNATKNLPDNKKFLVDVMSAIERYDVLSSRKPSKWYKPSSFHCLRNMYFTRMGAEQDTATVGYQLIGMADTGSRRHEAIQTVLLQMKDLGYDWEYVDVEEYVKNKQKFGKCLSLKVNGKRGVETHLFDENLKVSFMCDGIIRKISTNEYYLFEFKNVVSFKYGQLDNACLEQHHKQVITYCTLLDLDKAFVTYENRDTCQLEIPEVFEVTQKMKNEIIDRINTCESYVERMIAPPMTEDKKNCRWCPYRTICKKVG